MCEELGDVLFQIVFHSDIKKDENVFDVNDVIDGICKKMIIRHPHVFGDVSVADTGEVLVNWENIKNDEKQRKTPYMQLDSVAKSLPSLMRAQKLKKKADKTGLEALGEVSDFTTEALNVLNDIQENGVNEEKIGRLLFACAGISQVSGIEAEEALSRTNDAYLSSFKE